MFIDVLLQLHSTRSEDRQQLSSHKFKKGTEEYITLTGKLEKRVWNITDNVINEWQAEFTARFNYPKKKQTHVTWINIERKKISVLNVKTCTINQFHNLMRCVKKTEQITLML